MSVKQMSLSKTLRYSLSFAAIKRRAIEYKIDAYGLNSAFNSNDIVTHALRQGSPEIWFFSSLMRSGMCGEM